MHRNRTWRLNPIELRTQRNRILPIGGSDGITPNPTPNFGDIVALEGYGNDDRVQFLGLSQPILIDMVASSFGGIPTYLEIAVWATNDAEIPYDSTNINQGETSTTVQVPPGYWVNVYAETFAGGTYSGTVQVRNVSAGNVVLDTINVSFIEQV